VGEAGSGGRAAARFLSIPGCAPQRRHEVFGRRRGRPLRPGQKSLIDELLPRLAINLPASGHLDIAALFGNARPSIWLEIGFGGGEHLAQLAEQYPQTGFIGCEVFENGIVKLLGQIERRRLDNIRIFADDARLIMAALSPASVDRAFILFPDPWPKRRQHKRRIVSRATLDALAEIMSDNAELRLLDARTCYRSPRLRMAGPSPRRLARAPARLAADPLRGEGACRRPLPCLSPNETPATGHNQKLSHLLHAAAPAANLQRGLFQRLNQPATSLNTRNGFGPSPVPRQYG
jgi:tRNA (guanine-N7-)-methyltransferase